MSVSRVIARNTGVQAAADLLGKVASLAFYVVMARELGQGGFGDFTLRAVARARAHDVRASSAPTSCSRATSRSSAVRRGSC